MAEDADLIEKEWVEAVQHVMAATKGDPFQQTQAINALKVDYLKKRYNKDIKAAGE